VALADSLDHGEVNAIDANVKAFVGRGGKLLMYHGWTDMLIAPRNTINYYTSVVGELGGAANADEAVRLFMVPGMAHCSGGEGPGSFDKLAPLEQWVELKKAPDRIVASRAASTDGPAATRPLCPYPLVAVYSGIGSTNDAGSFACRVR
jgi:feruloyl esterase